MGVEVMEVRKEDAARLKARGFVPTAMTWRWAAEDPFAPYKELREVAPRARVYAEASDGEGMIYVVAMRRGHRGEARRFWGMVEDWEREYGLNRAFIQAARTWFRGGGDD